MLDVSLAEGRGINRSPRAVNSLALRVKVGRLPAIRARVGILSVDQFLDAASFKFRKQ